MNTETNNSFIGYEYKTITAPIEKITWYLDCYKNFGWELDVNLPSVIGYSQTVIRMKRNRKIINKTELTRLQKKFEACTKEIDTLEKTKRNLPMIWALNIGIIGTVFMVGSVFAVINEPPIIWLSILLIILALIGLIFPYFAFKRIKQKQAEKVQPIIEAKLDEIYEVCEKGYSLL